MRTKPKLATTFSEEEVIALDKLLSTARRGGDIRVIVRDTAITNVQRKFLSMREKAQREALS